MCLSCMHVAPMWEKLGEHFEGEQDLMIAKMDITKNEVESIVNMRLKTYPTFLLVTKDIDTNEVGQILCCN